MNLTATTDIYCILEKILIRIMNYLYQTTNNFFSYIYQHSLLTNLSHKNVQYRYYIHNHYTL